jgi:hypothetical protein
MPAVLSQSLLGHVSGALSCIYLNAGQLQLLIQPLVWQMAPQVPVQPLALLLVGLDH